MPAGRLESSVSFLLHVYLRAPLCSECQSAHGEIHGKFEGKMTAGIMILQKMSFA